MLQAQASVQHTKCGRCCARQVCKKDEQTEEGWEQRKTEKKVFEKERLEERIMAQKLVWKRRGETVEGKMKEGTATDLICWFSLELYPFAISRCHTQNICMKTQAFQLNRVKLPSRTLASKLPAKPSETTFSIKSTVSVKQHPVSIREMPAQLDEYMPECLHDHWYDESNSKANRYLGKEQRDQIPWCATLLSLLGCKMHESEAEDSPWQYVWRVL